jgi:hypothetical protein
MRTGKADAKKSRIRSFIALESEPQDDQYLLIFIAESTRENRLCSLHPSATGASTGRTTTCPPVRVRWLRVSQTLGLWTGIWATSVQKRIQLRPRRETVTVSRAIGQSDSSSNHSTVLCLTSRPALTQDHYRSQTEWRRTTVVLPQLLLSAF